MVLVSINCITYNHEKYISKAIESFIYIDSTSDFFGEWVRNGYYETKNMLLGNSTGYYSAAGQMMFFPEGSKLITGSGTHHFTQPYQGITSDIGYINDLFLGGIFYVTLLYLSILMYFISGIKKNGWISFYLGILMLATMILANIKGFGFRVNEFTNLFILISTVLVCIRKDYIIKQDYLLSDIEE